MATYVNDLRLKEIATGDESGTWGTSTNTNLELIANAMGLGAETIPNASTHTITMADGTADEFRSTFLRLTGGGTACTVTLAPNTLSHTWIMRNETAAALTLTQGSGANVTIAAGQTKIVATDGGGSGAIVYEMDDLELAGNLAVTGTATMDGLIVDGNDSYTSNIRFTYGSSAPTYFADWGYKSSSDGNKVFLTMTDGGSAKDVLVANYNGNVGIGTSSSSYPLEVAGAAGDSLTITARSGDATAANNAGGGFRNIGSATATSRRAQMWLDADGANLGGGDYFYIEKQGNSGDVILNQFSNADMIFQVNAGAERMRIDGATGNVGIGTSSPDTTLHLQTPSGTKSEINFAQTAVTNYRIGVPASTDALVFTYGASTERMRIDSAGNVGIGTSSPTQELEIKAASIPTLKLNQGGTYGAEIALRGNDLDIAGSANDIVFYTGGNNDVSTTERLRIVSNGSISIPNQNAINELTFTGTEFTNVVSATTSGFQFGTTGAGYLAFLTNNSEKARIDSSGNLLVGKTVGNSPGTVGFEVQQDGEVYSTIATGFNTYHVYANSGYRFYVNPNGGLYNYSANNVNLSDEREKKNIEALESQWDSLQQWSLKKFHYNADADSDTKKLGVIAQEVEVHNPEIISEFSVDEDTTRMAVKEQQMMWMAIKALQEAMERIETLEAKVQTLENN